MTVLFFNAFVDYSYEGKIESKVIAMLLERKNDGDFIECHREGSKCWVKFTSEFLKELSLNCTLEIKEYLDKQLSEGFKDYYRCSWCGEVIFNTSPITYRNNNGNIGSSIECVDCQILNNESVREIFKVKNDSGVEKAVEFLISNYLQDDDAEELLS